MSQKIHQGNLIKDNNNSEYSRIKVNDFTRAFVPSRTMEGRTQFGNNSTNWLSGPETAAAAAIPCGNVHS